jgi:hypothetical protein
LVAGLDESHRAKILIIKPAKSDKRCAASEIIARLLAKTPPIISAIMNKTHKRLANISFFRAFLSISLPLIFE